MGWEKIFSSLVRCGVGGAYFSQAVKKQLITYESKDNNV